MGGSDVHDMSYYGKCMIGGIFSCGLTHMAVCPLDIVKCRKQVGFNDLGCRKKDIYRIDWDWMVESKIQFNYGLTQNALKVKISKSYRDVGYKESSLLRKNSC
jgi:hypothetical protein